ncbi:MAG: NHLP family bacteriocin export ABC transporter permease/ATPase subunit, partial [Lachnospiraceae bacterium]|nr:NHLP family bacteriocin export ABC transporter permease/ATPase subunit [Lachnospiraceae bacterium]
MGWFDEQIKERLASDQEILEDSFLRLAGVVLDEKAAQRLQDERLIAKEALDSILKYYHEKPVEFPEKVKNIGDQLDSVLRPTGLMIRDVELTEGWQYDAYGPMLGFFRESGNAVALIPNPLGAYWFSDPASGKMTVVTKKNAGLFETEAFCFYQSLPMKPLGIPDLILYMKKSISNSDFLQIAAATLVVTLVGTIEPKVYSLVTGKILMNKQASVLVGMMVFLVSAAFASQMLSMVRSLLMERINTKTSLAVEASVMMRILSLPVNFFRKFSSGELSSRAQSVNSLCTMLLDNFMSVGLTSLMSLIYIMQIFDFARVLVVPSIIIILSTVIIGIVASLMQIDISRRRMKITAEESGMAFAMLNGIQKIRLSGSEKRVFARWAQKYTEDARLQYNPPLFIKLNSVLVTAISLIGTIILYYLAVRYGVSVSDYVGFNAAYGMVMGAFSSLSSIALSIAGIRPVLEMAEPILKAEPEVAADKEMVTKVSGSIEVSHVSFRYEENTPYVLKDLSLRIKAGEYVAIVGRTGCG